MYRFILLLVLGNITQIISTAALIPLQEKKTLYAALATTTLPQNLLAKIAQYIGYYTIQLLDYADQLQHNARQPLKAIAFSPDGQTFNTGGDDNNAYIWNLQKEQVICTLRGHARFVTSVSWSPDGRFVATGGADHFARIWNVATRSILNSQEYTSTVTSVSFNPCNDYEIAESNGDGDAYVIRWQEKKIESKFTSNTSWINSTCFNSAGTHVTITNAAGKIYIWNLMNNEVTTLKGHTGQVSSACFSRDGTLLASSSWDRTARIWNTATGAMRSILRGHLEHINVVLFHPINNNLVTTIGQQDKKICIWDISKERPVRFSTSKFDSWPAKAAAFSPDGTTLVTAHWDGMVGICKPSLFDNED